MKTEIIGGGPDSRQHVATAGHDSGQVNLGLNFNSCVLRPVRDARQEGLDAQTQFRRHSLWGHCRKRNLARPVGKTVSEFE